ncbi:MAG: hypothetical protein AABY18_02160 [Candidatus Thermoplasmatota archaeon]
MFFHLDPNSNEFGITTQAPPTHAAFDDEREATLTCLASDSDLTTFKSSTHLKGFVSHKPIRYDDLGAPQANINFHGLYRDAHFDDSVPMILYWYLTAAPPAAGLPADAPILPNVQVLAQWYAGLPLGIAPPEGPALIEGSSVPATLANDQVIGGEGQVRAVGQIGGRWVYEVGVPMVAQADAFSPTGANVLIDVRMDNPACPDRQAPLMSAYALHTSAAFRPRMVLGVTDPIRGEYAHPQFVGDDLVLYTSVSSPWGEYDIDAGNASITVQGPDLSADAQLFTANGSSVWGPQATDFGFVLANATSGAYHVAIRVPTHGSPPAVLTATVSFERPEAARESPAAPACLGVLGLVALAAFRRR